MTLVQKEVKKVYLGSTQVRPSGRQPGADTIAYYKFKDDRNDYSGNGYNVTSANNTQLTNLNGVHCLNLNSSYCEVSNIDTLTTYNNYTMIGWFNASGRLAVEYVYVGSWGGSGLDLFRSGSSSEIRRGNTTNTYSSGNWNIPSGQRFMFALVANNGVGYIYVNNTKTILKSSGVIAPNNNGTPLYIGGNASGEICGNGYISHLIIEKKGWTDQEILDYYNKTKGNYGL